MKLNTEIEIMKIDQIIKEKREAAYRRIKGEDRFFEGCEEFCYCKIKRRGFN